MKLAHEQRRPCDEEIFAERSFEVKDGGVCDENIRSELGDKLKGYAAIEDETVLGYASSVIVAEEEQDLRLFR